MTWSKERHKNYHRAKWVSDAQLIESVVNAARGLDRGGVVIDIGCGLGNLLEVFSRSASHCIGIDADEKMLERAIRKDNIEYKHCKAEEIDGFEADVVVARNVLHYIPGNSLAEIAGRNLKKGGIVVLTQAVPPSLRVKPWHDQLHEMLLVNKTPTTDDMVSFCRLANFKDIQSQFCFHQMNVNEWLDARAENDPMKEKVLEHHKKLSSFAEYEPEFVENDVTITVRFAIVSGIKI